LAISHVCNPFLPDEEADSFACSPTSIEEGVALTVANRGPLVFAQPDPLRQAMQGLATTSQVSYR
jgi:hypothetical protein